MSYILEALRKAERERNAGQVPDLHVNPRSEPSASRRPLMRQWLILGAALFAGLSIGIALWLRPLHAPESAPKTVSAAGISSSVAVTAPAPEPEVPAEDPESGAARLDDLLDKTDAPALSLEEQKKLSTTAAPTVSIIKPTEPRVITETPSAAPESHPTLAEKALAEPELPPELKKLKEMPVEYRSSFPSIRVDVHVYDEQPAARFVMINGRRYREGEVLAEGPRIVSIEEDGIVFNYRDVDVLFPITR